YQSMGMGRTACALIVCLAAGGCRTRPWDDVTGGDIVADGAIDGAHPADLAHPVDVAMTAPVGCCDGAGACHRGLDDAACGASGRACTACANGRCLALADGSRRQCGTAPTSGPDYCLTCF